VSRSRIVSVPLPFATQRDVEGHRVCVWCGTSLKGSAPQKRWCGQECVLTYKIARRDQGAARAWLMRHKLDKECAICHKDMANRLALRDAHTQAVREGRSSWRTRDWDWDADHIVPLSEGGAACPTNLRALCRPCHKAETKALRARLAAKRRAEMAKP
jgi:5-methylcytosine-specific restriction endonuclease McrA